MATIKKEQMAELLPYADVLAEALQKKHSPVKNKYRIPLSEIYKRVVPENSNICSSCNSTWVFRLATWYFKQLEADKKKHVVPSTKGIRESIKINKKRQ